MLISAIAHAPLLLYIANLATPARLRPRPPAATKPPAILDAAPIEIAFLQEEAEINAKLPRTPRTPRQEGITEKSSSAAAVRTVPSSPLISELGALGALGSLAIRSGDDAKGEASMRMRRAELQLEQGTAERIAVSGGEAPPDELRRSGKLQSQPGGRAIVHDRVATLHVDVDGKAHFEDFKDIDPKFTLPIPRIWEVENMRRELGHQLTEWFKDPEAGKRYGPSSDLPRHLQASPGACDQWGSTMCDDPLAPKIEQLVRERKKVHGGLLGGPMDITAWLHRKLVGDPYASRKRKLLDDTLDERVAMAEAHRLQQSARSGEYMRRNLEWLWAHEPDPVARRAALFELWDECSDDEPGLRARAMVIGWIRSHLPAGSPDAYTAKELEVLQSRRTSRAAFAPYDE